eukprot:362906-Chlamydomonas_euryale.AAC.1
MIITLLLILVLIEYAQPVAHPVPTPMPAAPACGSCCEVRPDAKVMPAWPRSWMGCDQEHSLSVEVGGGDAGDGADAMDQD